MRKKIILIMLVILMAADQYLKQIITSQFKLEETKAVIPGIFKFTYLRNYGAAFSSLQHQQWLFTLVTVVVITCASYYLYKQWSGSLWLVLGLILIISGGIGNFIDRLRLGYVVDMIDLDFMNFAIFNLADSYLVIGVFMLLIAFWKEEKNGSNH